MTGRIVVVGASVAGIRAAQALREKGYQGRITVLGEETEIPYDRPPLSKELLSGSVAEDDIRLTGEGELALAGIAVRLGVRAVGLDPERRRVLVADGDPVDYDAVVIATGVRARTLPTDAQVHTVRTLADIRLLRERLAAGGDLVVIGGGFIGAEVASTAMGLGTVRATIVEAAPVPFARVLGPEVGELVSGLQIAHGVDMIAGVGVRQVLRAGQDAVVVLADGRELTASVVVAGIGCVPNTEWLASAGIPVADGVVTDEYCRVVAAPGVYAIGDVARWLDPRSGERLRTEHWTNAHQQAELVAHNIVHPQDLRAASKAPYFWSDQHGVRIQMVGHAHEGDEVELVELDGPRYRRSVALYHRGDELTAAVGFGQPRAISALRRGWEQRVPVTAARELVAS